MGLTFSSLFSRLFSKKQMQILMIGLDAAGKTTILNKLKLGEVLATTPTVGFNVETVEYKNINFTVWDVGGQTSLRRLWRNYTENANAVIFVLDSTDYQRIEEAFTELHNILSEESLRIAPVLVFANKQDLPNPMNTAVLSDKMGLNQMKTRNWYIQATCATEGKGLYEGLDWLSNELSKM